MCPDGLELATLLVHRTTPVSDVSRRTGAVPSPGGSAATCCLTRNLSLTLAFPGHFAQSWPLTCAVSPQEVQGCPGTRRSAPACLPTGQRGCFTSTRPAALAPKRSQREGQARARAGGGEGDAARQLSGTRVRLCAPPAPTRRQPRARCGRCRPAADGREVAAPRAQREATPALPRACTQEEAGTVTMTVDPQTKLHKSFPSETTKDINCQQVFVYYPPGVPVCSMEGAEGCIPGGCDGTGAWR